MINYEVSYPKIINTLLQYSSVFEVSYFRPEYYVQSWLNGKIQLIPKTNPTLSDLAILEQIIRDFCESKKLVITASLESGKWTIAVVDSNDFEIVFTCVNPLFSLSLIFAVAEYCKYVKSEKTIPTYLWEKIVHHLEINKEGDAEIALLLTELEQI